MPKSRFTSPRFDANGLPVIGLTLLLVGFGGLTGCNGAGQTTFDEGPEAVSTFDWSLPDGQPLPVEPLDNPMSEARFQLGRHLFYDRRLSGNGTQSCADCHHQDKAFTDGRPVSVGSTGMSHPRNAQSLLNVAYHPTLTWANPSLRTLEQQIVIPLFGETPVEQGVNDSNREAVLDRLREEPVYADLFAAAWPDVGNPVDFDAIVKALATFVRGMVSFDTAFDRHQRGDPNALEPAARRGMALFFGEELECFHCHGGYLFSDSTLDRTMTFVEKPFHNTGLFNIGGTGAFPEDNQGVFEITADPSDMGRFRAPSLRNVAVTGPYMHDGSMTTLGEVVDFYAAGGRVIESGPHAGDGRQNPFKDGFISGFTLTPQDKADLLAFLESLTDRSFIENPRFSNPWSQP